MSLCRLIVSDIRAGIFRNKRLLLMPVLGIFECMSAHMTIAGISDSPQTATFMDLLTEIFRGCKPMLQNNRDAAAIPYLWLAVFILSIFIIFDYMHDDLTQFGIQILSRTRNRAAWWYSKCVWNLASGICCYILFLMTVLIFCGCSGYTIRLTVTPEIISALAAGTAQDAVPIEPHSLLLLLAPLAVICALNMIQMALSLICKPLFSFFITVGILILGVLFDSVFTFSRCGMLMMSNQFSSDGYETVSALMVCLILTAAACIAGKCYFKKHDIIPDKE